MSIARRKTREFTAATAPCSGSGDLHSQLAENRDLLAERGQKLERLQDRTALMESDAGVWT